MAGQPGPGRDRQQKAEPEERDGAFSFYCSQKCLEKSQRSGSDADAGATCDACAKRFQPDLVSQVVYIAGRRNYACSLGCRTQILREAKGARLGPDARARDRTLSVRPCTRLPRGQRRPFRRP